MRLRAHAFTAGAVVLTVCSLGWPGDTAASVAAGLTSQVECAFAGSHITVVPGPTGAGHSNVTIEVKNGPFEPCVLPIYPTVDLLDLATESYLLPNESPQGPLGTSATPTKALTTVTLPPGAVASAMLGGTDIPLDDEQTCPSLSYTVTLPGLSQPARFDGPLADCAGFSLGPFTLGFNGASPSGEIIGRAPPCASSQSTPGADLSVPVKAWLNGKLANLAQIVVTRTDSRRYQMVLSPGRYRITSGDRRARHVVVRAGVVDDIGRFGACGSVRLPTTKRTVPPKGLVRGPTTTTPKPGEAGTSPTSAVGGNGVAGGAAMPPCANDQLRISALRYGAASGAVSEIIEFTDISSEGCTLTGYPGIAALDSQGLQVEQARRQLNAMLGGQYEGTQPQTVPLEPGGIATATVQGSDMPIGAATTCPAYFPSLLVTAPDDTDSVTLMSVGMQGPDDDYGDRGFPGCGPLLVTPVVPGATGSPAVTSNTP